MKFLGTGYANPAAPVCGSQNVFNSGVFGFYPSSFWIRNPRMGNGGFRDVPRGESTQFYSIRAGIQDQILCATAGFISGCDRSTLFDGYSNVRSQLEIGYGSTAASIDFDLSDWTVF
ncbi:MAG: hypothetical protein AAGF12_18345 [Myxococcota bacterium]